MNRYPIDPEISYFTGPPMWPSDSDRVEPWTVKAVGPHGEEGVGFSMDEARADFYRRKVVALIRKLLGASRRPACETDRVLRQGATR